MRIYLEVAIRRIECRNCQGVKQEKVDWLADNPFYTKRFAFYIGRRCRTSSIQDVAKEHLLDWRTVKTLEMQYMREQIKRTGQPRPKVIGIDEISIRKGQTYRIVVSELDRRRAIWFGGKDRSEESMDMFFAFLGERSSKRVRLAVMDMWRPFRKSTNKNAPQAAILFDKFHILSHLGDALDKVRKQEYAKLDGEKRSSSKARSMHSFPTRRTCKAALERTSRSCWPPTSGSIPLTC
jgi:transposase